MLHHFTCVPGLQLGRYVQGAVKLSASLDAVNSAVTRIALTAYLTASHRALLSAANWCVADFTERYDGVGARNGGARRLGFDMLRVYHPLFTATQAAREGRRWRAPRNNSTAPPQARTDGAATYFKFVAWTLTSCASPTTIVLAALTL